MSPFIDIDLIGVYVPEASQLSLEEAMKVAIQRDEEAAENLEMSILDPAPAIEIPPEDFEFGDAPLPDESLEKGARVEALVKELYGLD